MSVDVSQPSSPGPSRSLANGDARGQNRSPLRRRLGRRKWDPQPTDVATVLVASTGEAIPHRAIRRALAASDGGAVAVLNLARIYGSAFGLPNPGLMPTKTELREQYDRVAVAVDAIEKQGTVAFGQVAATRRPVKTVARIAAVRKVRLVLVVTPAVARWRRAVEGDLARDIARRLGNDVTVEAILV